LYEVDMKPLRNLQDEAPQNISDLIAYLWKLYDAMTLDPALSASAEHIRRAVLELEQTRRVAWEVYREEQAAHQPVPSRKGKKRRKQDAESPTDWLRDVLPASPLKQ
jgi:hypothetical protein